MPLAAPQNRASMVGTTGVASRTATMVTAGTGTSGIPGPTPLLGLPEDPMVPDPAPPNCELVIDLDPLERGVTIWPAETPGHLQDAGCPLDVLDPKDRRPGDRRVGSVSIAGGREESADKPYSTDRGSLRFSHRSSRQNTSDPRPRSRSDRRRLSARNESVTSNFTSRHRRRRTGPAAHLRLRRRSSDLPRHRHRLHAPSPASDPSRTTLDRQVPRRPVPARCGRRRARST